MFRSRECPEDSKFSVLEWSRAEVPGQAAPMELVHQHGAGCIFLLQLLAVWAEIEPSVCRMAPGGGPCPAHPVLAGKAGLQWPEVAEHPPHPLPGLLGWESRPGQGRADIPLLIPPSCPLCSLPRCPASLGSHPRSASDCPLIRHLPALPSSLCLSRYLPLHGLSSLGSHPD